MKKYPFEPWHNLTLRGWRGELAKEKETERNSSSERRRTNRDRYVGSQLKKNFQEGRYDLQIQ